MNCKNLYEVHEDKTNNVPNISHHDNQINGFQSSQQAYRLFIGKMLGQEKNFGNLLGQ